MNLFTRKMHLFCVSNIMVSFVCTGFLGINGYKVIESPKEEAHEISLTESDTEPLSQNGEDEKRVNTIVGDVKEKEEVKVVPKNEKVNTIVASSNKKTTKKTTTSKKTTTTNVVTKKEVNKTVTYAPATYSSVTGDAIVSFARQFLGLRYKSGTPSLTKGADCSGFTMLIYREFGVSLPRTVGGQIGRGTYVNKKDLQKGDLVFYKARGSRGGATHVGIYIGSGQVIHESRPGVGVKINSVNMMQYVTARRVINSKAKAIAEQKLEEQKKNEAVTDNSSNITNDNNSNTQDSQATVNTNDNTVANTNTNDNIESNTTTVETPIVEEKIETKKEEQTEIKEEPKQTTNEETSLPS